MADHSVEHSADSFYSMFAPDVVLPSQFYGVSEDGVGGAERKLMAAVLADGIECYINSYRDSSEDPAARRESREWVENSDVSYVFGFDVVCESLGVNADYLRLGLRRYLAEMQRSRSCWHKIRRPRK